MNQPNVNNVAKTRVRLSSATSNNASRDELCVYPSEFRSQNRISSGTVRFIRVAITQVELRFETERWAACENTNVNIDCKIVLVLKSNAASMEECRVRRGCG